MRTRKAHHELRTSHTSKESQKCNTTMSEDLIKTRPFDSGNVRFNKDEEIFIENKMAPPLNSTYTAINDLKGNGKDWIIEAVDQAFEKIREKNCKIHQEELARHSKKLKVHDWWLWALSGAITVIILILIFVR